MVKAQQVLSGRWKIGLGTLTVLSTLFFFLGYDVHFFDGPYGMHFMRQTDSLSFVYQYYNDGYDFFNPKLFNLKNIEGRAACEFPITYYFTAILYGIIGPKMYILKLIHLIISFSGLFYVFKLAHLVLKDYVYASLVALFLCTSTVYNFYAFNYLPDTPALSFVLIAWYYAFKYQMNGQRNTLIKAFVFFTLGSLIKVTYLINPIALLIFYLFIYLFQRKQLEGLKSKRLIFKYGLISLLLVFSWNAYMIHYNQQYESHSFNTTILPIWELSKNNMIIVWEYVVDFWYTSYFAHSSFHLLIILALIQIILIKKSNYNITLLVFLLFLGLICFAFLFYSQFKDHDYYFLTFIPFLILLFINAINTLKIKYPNTKLHFGFKFILILIVFVGINYSKHKLTERRENQMNSYSKMGLLIFRHKEEIRRLNIPKNAKIILTPETSQNGGLLYLNRMGWTIPSLKDITHEKLIELKLKGANYLLLVSKDIQTQEKLKTEGELILECNDLYVFKLKQ